MCTQPKTIFFDWPETLRALARGTVTQEELDTGIFLYDSLEYLDLEQIFVGNSFRFFCDLIAKELAGEGGSPTDADRQRADTEVRRFRDALEKAENEHRLHSKLCRVRNWGTINELLERGGYPVWPLSECGHPFVRSSKLRELLTKYIPEARFVAS